MLMHDTVDLEWKLAEEIPNILIQHFLCVRCVDNVVNKVVSQGPICILEHPFSFTYLCEKIAEIAARIFNLRLLWKDFHTATELDIILILNNENSSA